MINGLAYITQFFFTMFMFLNHSVALSTVKHCATITTIHLENFFLIPNRNSVLIKQELSIPPSP